MRRYKLRLYLTTKLQQTPSTYVWSKANVLRQYPHHPVVLSHAISEACISKSDSSDSTQCNTT